MSAPDILEDLSPYFEDGLTVNDEEKLDELFGIFQRDFYNNPFDIDGIAVKVKIHPYVNNKKDGLPQYFSQYYEKFVHIISREINGKKKISAKQRQLEVNRANRIHWIKPILQHSNDQRITKFKYEETNGTVRNYYWYKNKKYMVITELVNPDYILITGFCVDDRNKQYYQDRYENRIG